MTSTIEGTLKRAQFMARHLNKCDLQFVTVAILLELGFTPKRAGFDYLKWAIIRYHREPTQLITKDIYSFVGGLYSPEASQVQVDQAIRRSIKEAWNNRNNEVWLDYFPGDLDLKSRPTNSEFISMISCFLELWQGCCEEVSYERI